MTEDPTHQATGAGRVILYTVLIASLCSCLCLIIGAATLLPGFQYGDQTVARNTMRHLAIAAIIYADEHKTFPHDPKDPSGFGPLLSICKHEQFEAEVLFHPSSSHPNNLDEVTKDTVSYEAFRWPIPRDIKAPGPPLLWEKDPHYEETHVVVFSDASAKSLKSEELRALIEKWDQHFSKSTKEAPK